MNENLNHWIMLMAFGLNFVASAGSYFKAISDIRKELQDGFVRQSEKVREESRLLFASKEEAQFIREALLDIKTDLKEIKIRQEKRREDFLKG